MRIRPIPGILAALAAFSWSAAGQVATEANRHYQTHEERERVARGLESHHRRSQIQPAKLVELLALKPGMRVADVGTGAGVMLPHLSEAVGPRGEVIAQDIHDDFLDHARGKAAAHKLTNLRFIRGSERDPNLPHRSVDLVLVLDTYHHFNYPEQMLAGIRAAMKPDGRLVVVDFYRRPDAMPGGFALEHIRLDEEEAVREIEANGFRVISRREYVPGSRWMAVFERRPRRQ